MRAADKGWVPDNRGYESVNDVVRVLKGGFEVEPDVV